MTLGGLHILSDGDFGAAGCGEFPSGDLAVNDPAGGPAASGSWVPGNAQGNG